MNKLTRFLAAAVALVATDFYGSEPVTRRASPNILFILTDDQGWADGNTPMDPNIPAVKGTDNLKDFRVDPAPKNRDLPTNPPPPPSFRSRHR